VVWFGESLPLGTINEAFETAQNCDLMFSIGTSAQIYPAAQLPIEAQNRGAFVIEINPEPTPFSPLADMSVRDDAGSALPKFYKDFHAQLK
jgi:NAD-dependent deacetylase